MKPTRAKQIWHRRTVTGALPFSFRRPTGIIDGVPAESAIIDPKGITRKEDKLIRKVWAGMSGFSTYMSAFHVIKQGDHKHD